ncbi:MAG: hypothetical protein JXB08_05960 [Bacilli bacterium]|nr:hypothetical protein [Bacilli bacterium]
MKSVDMIDIIRQRGDLMFILELLLTLFYFILILVIILLVLALSIPAAVLYLIYWILFLSWRPKKTHKKERPLKTNQAKRIKSIVKKSMMIKTSEEEQELEQEIKDIVKEKNPESE